MAIPTWGMLEKSQVDDETIEEAIARLILEHNEDEESHLGAGQSLQSHKAAEIIDHLAASIIEDKLGDREVSPIKLKVEGTFAQVQLESLDAWYQILDGAGGSIALNGVGCVSLVPGTNVDNRAVLHTDNPLVATDSDKDPFFQIFVEDGGDEACDIAVGYAIDDPFRVNSQFFGIKYVQADDKIYGFYIHYSGGAYVVVPVELATGAPYRNIWRAELNHTAKTIAYYINGVLKATQNYSATTFNFEQDYTFSFGAKKKVAVDDAAVWFMHPIYNQNL